MIARTVACPKCRAQFRLKSAPPGTTVADCPNCGAPIPLTPPADNSELYPTTTDLNTQVAPPRSSPTEFPFLLPPQAPDEIGRLGPYRVLSELGRGGMGVVFRAEDPHLKRLVALKVMFPRYSGNPADKARFLREARAQAAVEHDHVAVIHQVGEDQGVPFLAMPLLKGQSLADALQANPKVPLAEAVRIAREVAEGLSAAHAVGLIHRDIKPGNVWLEGNRRRVKILDFGLARNITDAQALETKDEVTSDLTHRGAITRQGAIIGTPAYMSPEQANGESVDFRSDLFSLGTVLYQMLAGRQPFLRGSVTATLLAVTTANPPRPRELNRDVPPALDALVMSLLEKRPEKRPASAEEVAARLREIEAGAGVTRPVAIPVALPPPGAPPDPWAAIDSTETEVTPVVRPPTDRHPAFRGAAFGGRWRLYVAFGLLVLAGVLAVVAVRARFQTGTLVVEVPDPDAEGRFRQGRLVLTGPDGKDRYALGPDEREKRIDAGTYKVRLEGVESLVLDPREFTLKKGEQLTLRVTAEPKPRPSAPKKPAPEPDPDRRGAEFVLSLGGKVRVNGEGRDITRTADLPIGAFRLTFFDLGSVPLEDGSLAPLRGCKSLQVIDLGRTGITDAELASLADCPDLLELHLNQTNVTDAGLARFKGCKKLQWLSLDSTRVTDAGLAHFAGCPDLLGLTLEKTEVTDAGLAHFKGCKKLQRLHLHRTRVTDAGLAQFAQSKSIVDLNLFETAVTDAGMFHFGGCSKLEYLVLGGTKVGDKGLAVFRDCKNLRQLDLSSNGDRVTDAGVKHFHNYKRLSILHLGETAVTDETLAVAAECPELEELFVWSTKITNDGLLSHLKRCKKLTILGISGTVLNDEGLAAVKDIPNLTKLSFGHTVVTDAGLAHLHGCKRLIEVNLVDTKVTAKGIDALRDGLPRCKIIWDRGTIEPKAK